jgi:hypothetical protein
MKSFKKILSEVAQPKSGDEQSFKDKHLVQVTSHPVASDHQHSGETDTAADKIKRRAKRIADYDYADDIAVYEGMDLDDKDLDKRYERERKKEIRDKIIDEKKLDPVGQEDDDIDNDGDVDDSDRYLHNRRKAIAKSMKESLLDITEKAKSQAQQKAAGIALAVKRGELPKSALIGAAKDMFKMSEKDLEDFASTKHKGLPEKIDESANESIELDEAKTDIYHKHMLKALGKSRLPKYHPYTSSIANNGDFVVYDGGGRIAGRIPKGEHSLKEELEQIDEISRDLARSYIRKVSDKNNTGEASPKEVMKRSPGVALAGKKAYGIGGKARVNATEEVELDEDSRLISIHNDYAAYKNMSTADLLKKHKASKRVSGPYTAAEVGGKQGLISDLLNDKYGNKHVKAYFAMKPAEIRKLTEEVELDEISKKTLGSYIKKAGGTSMDSVGAHMSDYGSSKNQKSLKKGINRAKGVMRAADRLTREEVELDENFKTGLVKLDDGSSVILKDQDAKLLNQLFKDLNAANRKKMMKAAMTDKVGFEEILGFAREAL